MIKNMTRNTMTAKTDNFLFPDQFSMIFTIGFKMILPRYAKMSINKMGAVCSHKNRIMARGMSHHRL